jgi:hypothetical protein
MARAYAVRRGAARSIAERFQASISSELNGNVDEFLAGTLAVVRGLVYPPLRHNALNAMMQIAYTPNLAEAARAASVPCRPTLVADDARPGFAPSLAERCVC